MIDNLLQSIDRKDVRDVGRHHEVVQQEVASDCKKIFYINLKYRETKKKQFLNIKEIIKTNNNCKSILSNAKKLFLLFVTGLSKKISSNKAH